VEAMEGSKTNEQSADIFENKGSRQDNRSESGNIYENKGSYRFKAGMSLKTHDLAFGGKAVSRRFSSAPKLGL
jgi:hypothetical protein